MYSIKDIELAKNNIEHIIEKIEHDKLNIYEPTRDNQMKGVNIVLAYIKEKKRKIYGGYAQNKLVVFKNPKDTFYKPSNIPDIDFYSPEPLEDVKAICDLLYEANIGENIIEGREAVHKSTYTIFLNYENACDISYVPLHMYNKMPFIEIEGINYVHPSFIYLDLYRVLSEPHFSSRTWDKHFARLYLLQKHYPFKIYKEKLNVSYNIPKQNEKKILELNRFILNEIKNKTSYIITGQLAYNYYLDESQILNTKGNNIYEYINIPLIQIISTNYVYDAALLIRKLKEYEENITFTEFYPFWQFSAYSTIVYYDKIPLLHIMSHNDRCTPIKTVTAKTFYDGKVVEDKKSFIQLGSFDIVFLMNLVAGFRCRVNELTDKCHYHNVFTSHLIEIRNHYFEKTNKNFFDDTIFQSFVSTCIGQSDDPMKERLKERRKKAAENKLVIYKYIPGRNMQVPGFKFANTSGNPIIKAINLKVTKYVFNPEFLENKDNISLDRTKQPINQKN